MQNILSIIDGIKANVKQRSASTKDEVTVMQALMNDRDYEVEVFKKNGNNEMFAPGREFRGMITNIVAGTTKMNHDEAANLVENYEFKRDQAQTMVDVNKEFILSYLETGRKFKLGGRRDSNVSLIKKEFEPGLRRYPTRIGLNPSGDPIMGASEIWVSGYSGIKASSPCPNWIPKQKR